MCESPKNNHMSSQVISSKKKTILSCNSLRKMKRLIVINLNFEMAPNLKTKICCKIMATCCRVVSILLTNFEAELINVQA